MKNLTTVFHKTISSIFILSSILFIDKTFSKEYIVETGDTLYSIALKQNIDLIDIYNSNKSLGLKPNSIRPGDQVYIPPKRDKSFSKNCYWYSHLYEFSLERPYLDNISNCLDFLSKKIDVSIFENKIDDIFWNQFNESDGYIYYAINMYIKVYVENLNELGPDSVLCPDGQYGVDFDASDCKIQKTKKEKKYLDIILSAAKKDNLHAFYFWDHWDVYLDEKAPQTTIWKLVWDEYDLDYLDSIAEDNIKLREFADTYSRKHDEFCERELYQSNFQYELKIYSMSKCLGSYGRENNVKFVEFFQNASNYINANQSKFISYNELAFVTDSAFYLLRAGYDDLATDIVEKFLNRVCLDCKDVQDLIETFFEYNDQNEEILGQGFYHALLALDLNYTSLQISNKNISFGEIKKIRDRSLKQYEKYFENFYQKALGYSLESDDGYSSILSDYALNLMRWGECQEASIYQDQAQNIYQNLEYDERYSFDRWDEFNESLFISDCFLSQSNYDANSSNWNSSKENALKYINIAEEFLNEFKKQSFVKEENWNEFIVNSYVSQISEALLKTMKLAVNFDQLSYEQLILKIKEIDNDLLSVRSEQTFGFQEEMRLIQSAYSKIYFYVINKYKNKNFDDLLDPIDIFNYESNLFTNSKIINLTVNASQKNLKNLQTLLQENTNKINMIRESNFEEDTYNDLAKIYNENAEIVRTILSTNENLNSILVSNLPNISEIQSRLRKDEFAIFFIDNIIYENGSAILISKNEIVNYSTDSYRNISFLIKNLQSSLNNIDSYDFQSAKKLYDIFFKPIEYLVPKDSTIYFLGDHLKGINPSILVKNFNASSNISEYERLVSANWLIEEYNVVKHFQIPSSSMQKINYDKKFLGYGNSTTYKQLGLVDLNEVNGEIKELALISNGSRDDILIDKNATKDKLLEKLNVSYERIAISTHAVESFWRGLTKEPALIFNNNDDDFFLTPSEIVDLKIDTDMVILSSCSSSTEGFDDLFKSFLVAGANSVVYTNWELESKYAKEFTTTFMKELWFSSDEKHEALRSTSLGFINNYDKPQYSHPAFWGNFSIAYRNL